MSLIAAAAAEPETIELVTLPTILVVCFFMRSRLASVADILSSSVSPRSYEEMKMLPELVPVATRRPFGAVSTQKYGSELFPKLPTSLYLP